MLSRWTANLYCLAIATVCFTIAGPVAAEQRKPNILLIMADDMGYECVGANGGTSYRTPSLDTLAADGMRFTHCYSQPICTPSRVQIMTGIYNHRNYLQFGVLDESATTFAQLLKRQGYATCVVGKWQLKGGLEAPHHFGFDEYCLWQLTRRPGRYPNPGLEVNGRLADYIAGEYGPDLVSDYLCDFMERHREQPFLAYYPMILPHWPFEPTPNGKDWNPQAKGALSGVGDMAYFADMVQHTDQIVGKLVAKLDQLGIRDRTLVLFTCDNGTYAKITSLLEGKPIQGGKGLTTDAGTHVPLIASWPGTIASGAVCQDLIDFSDVLPTLVELAGGQVPADLQIDGRSFVPQLRGELGMPREWIYCWYARNGKQKNAKQFVRDRRFKRYADGRFLDLQADPLEQDPLQLTNLDSTGRAKYDQFGRVLEQMEKTAKQR